MAREVDVPDLRDHRYEWTERIRVALYAAAYAERFPDVTRDPISE